MNLLLVDDNENCLQLLEKIVQFIPGAQGTSASGGCEAWWHLSDSQKHFDLLIADVSMPMVNGLELTKRIRATPSLAHLRIILCSAVHDRKTVESFQPLGIAHYVVKPYGLATLLHKIKQAMGTAE
jgi:two-component system, chemotaxis family, chemotaxis protein CheY